MPEIQLPTKAIQDYVKAQVDKIVTDLPKSGKKLRSKVFTSTGTFEVPAGVTELYLTGGGGGGGGGWNASPGKAGGTTSFSYYKSLSGGGGGTYGAAGLEGGPGGSAGGYPTLTSPENSGGWGGGSGFYPPTPPRGDGAYCCGGGGDGAGSGGGGGDFVIDYPIYPNPGSVHTITIGEGGQTGGTSGRGFGGKGILIIKWWE